MSDVLKDAGWYALVIFVWWPAGVRVVLKPRHCVRRLRTRWCCSFGRLRPGVQAPTTTTTTATPSTPTGPKPLTKPTVWTRHSAPLHDIPQKMPNKEYTKTHGDSTTAPIVVLTLPSVLWVCGDVRSISEQSSFTQQEWFDSM